MSGALAALATLGTVVSPLQGQLASVLGTGSPVGALFGQPRSIGTIIPDVTIEESFSDRVQVTQHPRASGTPMNDHVYRQPRTVVMRCGWSNSNVVGSVVSGAISGGLSGALSGLTSSFTETRVIDVYQQLLALQFDPSNTTAPVTPFNVQAGKRTYQNMVIAEIGVRNDSKTEYALIADIHLQEVITVSATVTPAPSSNEQSMPQKTAATANGGAQQPTPQSFFRSIGGPQTLIGAPAAPPSVP
jgi:hypothetical protein